jgi:hypothetical protein
MLKIMMNNLDLQKKLRYKKILIKVLIMKLWRTRMKEMQKKLGLSKVALGTLSKN